MATPRLVVAGNCQARFVAKMLEANPAVNERYKVVYFRNFRSGDQGVLDEKTLRNCAVLLEQVAHQAPEMPHKAMLPKWTQVVRFPVLWFNSLWPTFVRDPRNPPKEVGGPGLWPYGDRIIVKALDSGRTPEQAVNAWFATDVAASLDLDRFHEINAAKMLDLDARSELKMARYVLDSFRREKLFVTHNHPSFRMLEVLRDKVFDALGLPASDAEVEEASGGMYHTHNPIHPTVARHFGLEWFDPESPARVRNVALPARDYFKLYAGWEQPPNPEGAGLDLDTE